MTAPVFVDTNVLIYWVDGTDPAKQRQASLWMAELWGRRTGRTSFQVLQEFFVAASRKNPGARKQLRAEVRHLLAWRPIAVDGAIIDSAWKIQDRYRLSFWDSLIVAAAKAASCRWLLTEDLQDSQVLDGVTIVNPFLRNPEDLSA